MSHLRLVDTSLPLHQWHAPTLEVEDETPPPLPREAVATAKVDDIFGDLFTPKTRPESKEVTLSRGTPKTPTIDEIEGLLPPAVLARMREAMAPTPAQRNALGLNEDDEIEPPAMPREAGHIPFEYQGRPRRRFTRTRTNEPRIISARFPSRCHETGNEINTGESILWYPLTKEVYCEDSQEYRRNV